MGRKDYLGGGIFIALGIFIFVTSLSFPELDGGHPGPSLFPRVLAILFILFGGIVVWQGRRSVNAIPEDVSEEAQSPVHRFNPVLVIILIAAFIAFANTLGFFITGSVVLTALMIRLRVSALKSAALSIFLVAFIYTIFSKGLRVPLPIGYLGW